MNILYVVHDNKKGGAAISFLEMISIIRKQNNVYVLMPHKNGFIPEQLDKMGIMHDHAHYFWWKISLPSNAVLAAVKVFVYKILNIWNYLEAKRVKAKIKKLDIDIIHSNSSVIQFGGLLSGETGIPHIWHLREYGKEDFNLVNVTDEKRYKKEMAELGTCYIAISNSIKEKFSHIVVDNKIYRIYNGVSEKFQFEKKFDSVHDKTVIFLISGNYCKEKGQTDVARAAVELRKRNIENFQVYFAGAGNFEEPRKIVNENGIQKYVRFLGMIDDMVKLRKETDVEIVASKCEAFGRVTIEAMRMSNPVIATNAGGSSELIVHEKNGLLYPSQDEQKLADCMERFILQREQITVMGQNAYLSVKGKYTPEENAENIENLYKRVLRNDLDRV